MVHGGGAAWSTVTSRGVVDKTCVEVIVEAYATMAAWGGVAPHSLLGEGGFWSATLTARDVGGETRGAGGDSGSGGNVLWHEGRRVGPVKGDTFVINFELLRRL